MLIDLLKIEKCRHILIVANHDSFANASALYSYILTLHKKVSLFQSDKVGDALSFLPWFDKIRDVKVSSAEYVIEMSEETQNLYTFFQTNKIKINKKMATSLYMGLLQEHKNWSSKACDGTSFAIASELIAFGAEYQLCRDFYLRRVPLCLWRLKAKMYANMQLSKSATLASLFISDEELQATGATLEDAFLITEEVLTLVHVKEALLCKSDENNRIIKEIQFEKK